MVWACGPIIHDKTRAANILESILREVYSLAREWNATQIYGTSPPLVDNMEKNGETFSHRSFLIQEWGTFITDVTCGQETIWNSLDKKTRNGVRRAEARGISIREVTDEDLLSEFARLSTRFNQMKKGTPDIEEVIRYYKTFLKCFHESYQTASPSSSLLLAYEKEPRAGLMLNSFNGNVTQHNVISDGSRGNLGGPLLGWEAIKWAQTNSCRTLDLVGVNPTTSNPEEEGICFYKSQWGGAFRKQYNVIKIMKPLNAKVFAGYVKLQNKLWSIEGLMPGQLASFARDVGMMEERSQARSKRFYMSASGVLGSLP